MSNILLNYIIRVISRAEGAVSLILFFVTLMLNNYQPVYPLVEWLFESITILTFIYATFLIFKEQETRIVELEKEIISLEKVDSVLPPDVEPQGCGRLTVNREGRQYGGKIREELSWSLAFELRITPASDTRLIIPFERCEVQVTLPQNLETVRFQRVNIRGQNKSTTVQESANEIIITDSAVVQLSAQHWTEIQKVNLAPGSLQVILFSVRDEIAIKITAQLLQESIIAVGVLGQWLLHNVEIEVNTI